MSRRQPNPTSRRASTGTTGWPARVGDEVSGVGLKIAKPCCPLLLTVVKSPPRKSWVPSVAITRGPRLLPFVFGVQCPIEPSTSDWVSSRCVTQPPDGLFTCGKPPGEYAQSWAWDPLYSQPLITASDWVAPRQSFCHASLPLLTLTAKSPSKQPPPVPSLAIYAVLPLITMSLTAETQLELFGTKLDGSAHGSDEPSTGFVDPIACCVTPLNEVKYPPIMTRESSGAAATDVTVPFTTGAHGSSAPEAAVTAPTRFRTAPPSMLKLPPR